MGETMATSIKLAKEWIAAEHSSINSSGFDRFLVQHNVTDSIANQSKTFGTHAMWKRRDFPLRLI